MASAARLLPTMFLASILLCPPAWALKTEKFRRRAAGTEAAGTPGGAGQEIEVVSEVASVRFSSATSKAQKDAALAPLGMSVVRERDGGWTLVGLPSGMTVAAGLGLLAGVSGVLDAQPDRAYRPLKTPNDPYADIGHQYHLGKIDAYSAWEYGVGDQNLVTIAVIDSGIDSTHPDLASKLVGTSQFCDPGTNKTTGAGHAACVPDPDGPGGAGTPKVACSHATQVAGVAAAVTNNGTGVAGVSWGAKLVSLRVFKAGDCNPTGDCSADTCATDDWAISDAVKYARLNLGGVYGKFVINISIGGSGACDATTTLVRDEIALAVAAGIPVFAAAGNSGGAVEAPGNCSGAIPVGATDENDNVAGFSSQGPELAANGFVAPGVRIFTTNLNAGYATNDGTSFSSPIGAGAAALLLAYKPTMTVADIKNNLRGSADNIGVASLGAANSTRPLGNVMGAGRLNLFRAARLTAKGTLADFEGDQKAIAFPNPFKPSEQGMVTITIPTGLQGKNPKIRIYGMDGQLVRDLGGNTSWDGKNGGGNPVATGTYIFHVKTDQGHQTGRVAVIR